MNDQKFTTEHPLLKSQRLKNQRKYLAFLERKITGFLQMNRN
jgi:hypothetical protein